MLKYNLWALVTIVDVEIKNKHIALNVFNCLEF